MTRISKEHTNTTGTKDDEVLDGTDGGADVDELDVGEGELVVVRIVLVVDVGTNEVVVEDEVVVGDDEVVVGDDEVVVGVNEVVVDDDDDDGDDDDEDVVVAEEDVVSVREEVV